MIIFRKYTALFLITIFCATAPSSAQTRNVFSEADAVQPLDAGTAGDPGGDGLGDDDPRPTPIDSYEGMLFILGVGIAAFAARKVWYVTNE